MFQAKRRVPSLLLAALLVLLHAVEALATVSFSPIRPPTCPATVEFAADMYLIDPPSGNWEVPKDPNCQSAPGNPCPHYINNVNQYKNVAGNAWTTNLDVQIYSCDIEAFYDRLQMGQYGLADHLSVVYGQCPGPAWYPLLNDPSLLPAGYANFVADTTITRQGFAMNRGRICTSLSTARTNPSTYLAEVPTLGYLQGTNDVVELNMVDDIGSPHIAIALGGIQASAGADFDLYVRCGAPPTPTQFDQSAVSLDTQEFVHIQSACTGTRYVTVHSYNGSGAFWLTKTQHYANAHKTLLVNKNWSGSPDYRPQWSSMLTLLVKRVYGATEGNVFINDIQLYNGPDCNHCGVNPDGTNRVCNLCFKNICCNGSSGLCGGAAELLNNAWFDQMVATHEIGHLFYCTGDEYVWPNAADTQCGHTLMANSAPPDNANFCTPLDHKKDKKPSTPQTTLPSGREQALSAGIGTAFNVNLTYDEYDYANFDFNGELGGVVLK